MTFTQFFIVMWCIVPWHCRSVEQTAALKLDNPEKEF